MNLRRVLTGDRRTVGDDSGCDTFWCSWCGCDPLVIESLPSSMSVAVVVALGVVVTDFLADVLDVGVLGAGVRLVVVPERNMLIRSFRVRLGWPTPGDWKDGGEFGALASSDSGMFALSSSIVPPLVGTALPAWEFVVDRKIFLTFRSTLLVRVFFFVGDIIFLGLMKLLSWTAPMWVE
jgi:hypothetical protein